MLRNDNIPVMWDPARGNGGMTEASFFIVAKYLEAVTRQRALTQQHIHRKKSLQTSLWAIPFDAVFIFSQKQHRLRSMALRRMVAGTEGTLIAS